MIDIEWLESLLTSTWPKLSEVEKIRVASYILWLLAQRDESPEDADTPEKRDG